MSTNARIRNIAPGVDAEMIAVQTHIFYNPKTQDVSVSFQATESLIVNGQVGDSLGGGHVMQVDLSEMAQRKFSSAGIDPVTGANLTAVSIAGVMQIIKAAYDTLYNERSASAGS